MVPSWTGGKIRPSGRGVRLSGRGGRSQQMPGPTPATLCPPFLYSCCDGYAVMCCSSEDTCNGAGRHGAGLQKVKNPMVIPTDLFIDFGASCPQFRGSYPSSERNAAGGLGEDSTD